MLKKKIGGTEYGIGWLPLGGYVKISGMIDESMDTEHLNAEPQPGNFDLSLLATTHYYGRWCCCKCAFGHGYLCHDLITGAMII